MADRFVPPFFKCGECGGEVGRYPVRNLLSQNILDWRHRDAPPGVAPHRPILGTKAHHVSFQVPSAAEAPDNEDDGPEPAPSPEVPARPALHGELPGPAVSLDKSADVNGWEVEAWIMRGTLMDVRWKALRVITSVVMRLRRDGVGLVATWRTKSPQPDDVGPAWEFDGAWQLGHVVEPLGGNELKTAVKFPRIFCETCGEVPARHVWTKTGMMCFNDWVATNGSTEEVAP